MRGESRRCRGSMEPLRRLPDGALATRRIVSFFVRCCGGGALRKRAAQKACSSPDLAKLCRRHAAAGGTFSWYRANTWRRNEILRHAGQL